MTDIVNAMSQLPFVAGFVAGGTIFGFLALAIGWAKGVRDGWDRGWKDAHIGMKEPNTRIHNW